MEKTFFISDRNIYKNFAFSKPNPLTSFGFTMFFLLFTVFFGLSSTFAMAQTQSLKLYYVHTHEKAEIVFKRDGKFDQEGLKKLNYFLRDWRHNEPTNMDPRLFELLWTVYQLSGSHDYIHVLSAYRSPATNKMLRSRSKNSGVAKSSQHVLGRAMDFYLPDVDLKKLRALAMKQEAGGVGYYPTSGSPFVHLDVGGVRHWPRMSRKELLALFPDGKTMYVPSDGRVLPGYAQAKANYQARQGQPIMMASLDNSNKKSGGFFKNLFGGGNQQETNQQIMVASATTNTPIQNLTAKPTIASLDLPENDAPLPTPSPLWQSDKEQEEEDDENIIQSLLADNSSDNTNADKDTSTLAYARIPVPLTKPEVELAIQNITTIPIPAISAKTSETYPQIKTQENIKSNNKNESVIATINPSAKNINSALNNPSLVIDTNESDIASLNASNSFIPIPDDDEYYDEEEDYADIEEQESSGQNSSQLNALNDKGLSLSSLTEQELLHVPDVVYMSGLVKQDTQYDQQLHGRAVEFHPIARIR